MSKVAGGADADGAGKEGRREGSEGEYEWGPTGLTQPHTGGKEGGREEAKGLFRRGKDAVGRPRERGDFRQDPFTRKRPRERGSTRYSEQQNIWVAGGRPCPTNTVTNLMISILIYISHYKQMQREEE